MSFGLHSAGNWMFMLAAEWKMSQKRMCGQYHILSMIKVKLLFARVTMTAKSQKHVLDNYVDVYYLTEQNFTYQSDMV